MDRLVLTLLILLIFRPLTVSAQQTATLKGVITNENNEPLFPVSISIQGEPIGTVTDNNGNYTLKINANETKIIVFSHLGYQTIEVTLTFSPNQVREINLSLKPKVSQLDDVVVYGTLERENSLIRIDIKSIDQLPNSSGNLETILKTLPGVVSGNELSSQYSVRGGSFEENLIYVNDIEIHRPLLVQSAQQEGLSFINSGMVSSIQFSAGGFNAEYGDKLSSVLDIKYKQPAEFSGSVSGSLLGGSALVQGASKNNRFSIISGIRYKSTQYLLKTLDIDGDYKPTFTDFQTYMTYDISKKFQLSFLGNYAANRFIRIPLNRDTEFGTFQSSFNFRAFYEGREEDKFDTYLGAVTLNFHPNEKLSMKLIASAFESNEKVTYDIETDYWISEALNSSTGSKDSLVNIGVGGSLDHARNYLNSRIYSIEHKSSWFTPSGNWKWGVKFQYEYIDDQINEWQLFDSAGISLPYSDEEVNLYYVYKAKNTLKSQRYTSFIQHTSNFEILNSKVSVTLGARAHYWTFNKDITVSPRANLTFTPGIMPNLSWHFSTGLYYQPPYYKELRDEYGNLYPGQKAQRALHYVAGTDYRFMAWKRPFIFTAEVYYKHLTRIIPYKIRDVRLQYLPEYRAKGYATGIDFKVYGEFVPGTESWFSLSFLSTREDIYNDFVVNRDNSITYPGYYRRPTDQWMNFSLFFQDYLPSNPNYKVHLMLIYGTGLPYSGPSYSRPADVYSLGAYRRIDIGFSRIIVRKSKLREGNNTIWISFEILNLLDAKNKVSYDWVRTVENNDGYDATFGVPNYLTGRSYNVKITANF